MWDGLDAEKKEEYVSYELWNPANIKKFLRDNRMQKMKGKVRT